MIEPNTWIEVGNSFAACIKQTPDKTAWEVWVVTDDGNQFRSASGFPSEEDAARNLTEVVAATYGDERTFTTNGLPAPRRAGEA